MKDLGASCVDHLFVPRVFPLDQVFDDLEETLSLSVLFFLGWELVGVSGRIVDKLREEDRPARCERSPSPPEVERGRVSVPDGFLAR